MTGFKFKLLIDGLKLWSASHCTHCTRLTFSPNFSAARIHMCFSVLRENVSPDFLPVYVLMPTTKYLKNQNELLPRNGG